MWVVQVCRHLEVPLCSGAVLKARLGSDAGVRGTKRARLSSGELVMHYRASSGLRTCDVAHLSNGTASRHDARD